MYAKKNRIALVSSAVVTALLATGVAHAQAPVEFLPKIYARSVSTSVKTTCTQTGMSAVAGDLNPYGVSFAPAAYLAPSASTLLQPGSALVANFNNNQNAQGTGTSVVVVPALGTPCLFFQAPAASGIMGMSAAFSILSNGYTIAGYVPVLGGLSNFSMTQPGGLVVLDPNGKLLFNFQGGGKVAGSKLSTWLNGPWGMATYDMGTQTAGGVKAHTWVMFVSNVLTGTILRSYISFTGGQFNHSTVELVTGLTTSKADGNLAAHNFLQGPSGLAYDSAHDILYFANSEDNSIHAVHGAGGTTVSTTVPTPSQISLIRQDKPATVANYNGHGVLRNPLSMALAPNGHLLVANSDGSLANPDDPSTILEINPADGSAVREILVDPMAGGAFGLATGASVAGNTPFAYVNDNGPTLTEMVLPNAGN